MNEFIRYLESQVDKAIYVWGAQGQAASFSLIDNSKNTDKNKAYAKALLAQRIKEGKTDIKAYDCSGLAMWYLQKYGYVSHDMSSRGMYNVCEKIKRSELKKGDWVFRYSYTRLRIVHVGYVVDDAPNVVEDKSSKEGVIKKPLDYSKWNRYGRQPYFKYEEEDIMIKKGDSGKLVKTWQQRLEDVDYKLSKYGVDGKFGSETETATNAFKEFYRILIDPPCTITTETWAIMTDVLTEQKIELAKENIELTSKNNILTNDNAELTTDRNTIHQISAPKV